MMMIMMMIIGGDSNTTLVCSVYMYLSMFCSILSHQNVYTHLLYTFLTIKVYKGFYHEQILCIILYIYGSKHEVHTVSFASRRIRRYTTLNIYLSHFIQAIHEFSVYFLTSQHRDGVFMPSSCKSREFKFFFSFLTTFFFYGVWCSCVNSTIP